MTAEYYLSRRDSSFILSIGPSKKSMTRRSPVLISAVTVIPGDRRTSLPSTRIVSFANAMRIGKLQYRQNYAHGNPYFRVLRREVELFAQQLYGKNYLEKQKIKYELEKTNREINSLKRKLKLLEKQKIKLMEEQESLESWKSI